MQDDLELIAILCIFILAVLVAMSLKLEALGRRIGNIETALGLENDLARAGNIRPDVEALIKRGKINQAIKVHWQRHPITVRDAELIVRRHALALKDG